MTARVPDVSVAVLGLGDMGGAIAARLAAAGFSVTGYDPCPGQIPTALASADSATAAVASARFVVTVLPGTPELRSLMVDDALLDELRPSTTWIDCTSTDPDVAEELIERAGHRNVARLDCGLGGGPPEARDGGLTLYVGGSDDVLAQSRPLLEAIAAPDRIHHLGGPGCGTLAKLLVNLIWFGEATLIAESLLLARSAGLDPHRLGDLLGRTPAASAFVSDYLPRLFAGDVVPTFGLDRVVEELTGLEQLAQRMQSPFPVGSAVGRVHRHAHARHGDVPGELLGAAHLEEVASCRLTEEPA